MIPADVAFRLTAAVLVGTAIGLNRDLRGKPAGVRTHALVSLGSAVVTVIAANAGAANTDVAAVSRVMQGIITGIGFLGAGVILHQDQGRVRGLTTAASIWIVAALGIACGVGDWWPVGLGTGLTLLVLMAGGPLERAMHRLMGEPREAADAEADRERKPPTDG
jgi:putative Mg2+ transporter-C (MgtC) family protein